METYRSDAVSRQCQPQELLYYPSSTDAQRLRLALGWKQQELLQTSVAFDDDEPFFDLGVARQAPVIRCADGSILTDCEKILWQLDELFPASLCLVDTVLDKPAWQALLEWRAAVDDELQRLYAPILIAYTDIAASEDTVKHYKSTVKRRFGVSAESLANARYDLYASFASKSRLPELARHLSENQYYMGQPSIADCVLAADLYPLQLMDGLSMPVDLLYYLRRVVKASGVDLNQDLMVKID